MVRSIQVTFDAANPDALARFWAAALDYILQPPPEGYASWEDVLREWGVPEERWDSASAIVDPQSKGPRIYFQNLETVIAAVIFELRAKDATIPNSTKQSVDDFDCSANIRELYRLG